MYGTLEALLFGTVKKRTRNDIDSIIELFIKDFF